MLYTAKLSDDGCGIIEFDALEDELKDVIGPPTKNDRGPPTKKHRVAFSGRQVLNLDQFRRCVALLKDQRKINILKNSKEDINYFNCDKPGGLFSSDSSTARLEWAPAAMYRVNLKGFDDDNANDNYDLNFKVTRTELNRILSPNATIGRSVVVQPLPSSSKPVSLPLDDIRFNRASQPAYDQNKKDFYGRDDLDAVHRAQLSWGAAGIETGFLDLADADPPAARRG